LFARSYPEAESLAKNQTHMPRDLAHIAAAFRALHSGAEKSNLNWLV
jgi:hypothetical protein